MSFLKLFVFLGSKFQLVGVPTDTDLKCVNSSVCDRKAIELNNSCFSVRPACINIRITLIQKLNFRLMVIFLLYT